MSQNLPVILAYYAQSRDNTHLTYLRDEYAQICEQWDNADTDENNPIKLKYRTNPRDIVTPDDIRNDITRNKERILIFHFSGHTGSDAIFLSSGTGRAEGLAGLLQQNARNLKLVFLNGCANEKQVEVLFAHAIPVVIATQCNVGDRIATSFSRYFYETLTTYGKTIQEAYASAIHAVRFDGDVADSLPPAASEQAEVYEADRGGGLRTTVPFTDIWKLYVRQGAEWVANDPDWWRLPGSNEVPKGSISLEKAYTCDRVANTRVFQAFFENHGRTKSVHHYLVVDELELSPQGLSYKLVYEHITRQQLLNRFFYQCDPNETPTNEGFVLLSRYDDAARIANKVYVSLLDEFTRKVRPVWNRFEDFYELNVVRQRDYVIVFIQIDEAELSGVAGAVREFMTQSTAYAATHPPAQAEKRAKLLFFWHIVVDKEPEATGLTGLWRGLFGGVRRPDKRLLCVEQFGSLYNTKDPAASTLWVVNENVRPLPIPQEDDIKDWLLSNDFLQDPHLTNPAAFDNDVRVLEKKFRILIEDKRAREAASRS